MLLDRKPYYAIQQSPNAPKPSSKPTIDRFLKDLDTLDFHCIRPNQILALTEKLSTGNIVAPLGSIDVIDYFLKCDLLRPASLNPTVQGDREERAHVPELLKNLIFKNVYGIAGAQSSTLALPLGRLFASHHCYDRVRQSRWVIVIDQSHLLWALYADDIDKEDVLRETNGSMRAYNSAWDTAFGARREAGEKVICLGSIADGRIPFKLGEELNCVSIKNGLKWSTSSSGIDIREPSISSSTVKRLLDTNTQYFKIPDRFSWILNIVDIFKLESQCGYLRFCIDIQNINKDIFIGRELVNAAWCKVVARSFMLSSNGSPDMGIGLRKRVKAFNDCMMQCQGLVADSHWERESLYHDGLKATVSQDNMHRLYSGIHSNSQQVSPFDVSVDHVEDLQRHLVNMTTDFHYLEPPAEKEMSPNDKITIINNGAKTKADGIKPVTTLDEAKKRGWIRDDRSYKMESKTGDDILGRVKSFLKRELNENETGEENGDGSSKKIKSAQNAEIAPDANSLF